MRVDLTGRRALVTGGASGTGVETARALASAGADVVIAVRDTAAGERTAQRIADTVDGPPVRVRSLDLADRASVAASVAAFVAAWDGPLHVLVANAGVMACPLWRTADGWANQLATNHLGHFALATGLRPALAAAGGARLVSVSSSAHVMAGLDLDDPHFDRRPYDPWTAYGQSKTANVLFAVDAARRWADDGIAANALMPGAIHTALGRHLSDEDIQRLSSPDGPRLQWKTPEQGAATSVLLAASPLVDGVTGRYFEDCQPAAPHGPGTLSGVAPHALDPEAARRLWDWSLQTVA